MQIDALKTVSIFKTFNKNNNYKNRKTTITI